MDDFIKRSFVSGLINNCNNQVEKMVQIFTSVVNFDDKSLNWQSFWLMRKSYWEKTQNDNVIIEQLSFEGCVRNSRRVVIGGLGRIWARSSWIWAGHNGSGQ